MTASLSSSASYGNASTGGDGGFAFDGLQAGTYRFEAGEPPWGGRAVPRCVRTGVVLAEEGRIEKLELRLQPPCRVEGLVTGPDGQPAAGASVFARDEGGNIVQRWPPVSTDASGRFVVDGLMPGKTTFAARTKSCASPESAPVTVKAGETAKMDLAMRAGTRLRVVVRDGEDRVVGAFVTIADASGRDMTAMYGFQDVEPATGEAAEGQRIGPVPPGRYRVTATNHDGTSASDEVSVSGDPEMTVTLRFGG
jgi:hypothetical protein